MKSQELRQAYLDFFKGHGHTVRPSSRSSRMATRR